MPYGAHTGLWLRWLSSQSPQDQDIISYRNPYRETSGQRTLELFRIGQGLIHRRGARSSMEFVFAKLPEAEIAQRTLKTKVLRGQSHSSSMRR